ncbi:MAG: response regulator transcription factor [Deltaproteobacteria bacterium]|nr:response regulator transcription factor [Deltaproteobacteria bacterium]
MSDDILVIEDDPHLLLGLALHLEQEGYRVRTANDGPRGLGELARERPDLVLLDLMLPGVDGLEILRRIRSEDPVLPVVVLTALGSEHDKVRGLDLGANDYVTKPFSVGELQARIRAVLRASRAHEPVAETVMRAGEIELEPETRRVRVAGEEVALSAKEFDLLRFFMERPERVLTRAQILTGVWSCDYEGTERTVDNVVSALRQALGEDLARRHLATVWGVGYRFVP